MIPAEKYLLEMVNIAKATSKRPFGLNPGELIFFDSVSVELRTLPNLPSWVHFDKIKAFKTGRGDGSKVAKIIFDTADKHQVAMLGSIQSQNMSQKKLEKWYEKFGCIRVEDDIYFRPQTEVDVKDLQKVDYKTLLYIKHGLTELDLQNLTRQRVIVSALAVLGCLVYMVCD